MSRITLAGILSLAFLLFATARVPADEPATPSMDEVKTAIEKALPLLLKGAEGHVAKRTCFACHNQGVPMLALTIARQRGFAVPNEELKRQLEFIAAFLDGNRENYRQGKGQGGQVDTAGYALLALEAGGWEPDATTEAVVDYLLQRDKDQDHWRRTSNRPPSEATDFSATYLAVRALRVAEPGNAPSPTQTLTPTPRILSTPATAAATSAP